MIKVILFVLIIACVHNVTSQTTFRTQEGHVIASGTFDSVQFIAESSKLFMIFKNEYRSMHGAVSLNTFETGITEFDSVLSKSKSQILFIGNVPVDFLSWDHNELNLDILVAVTINSLTYNEILKANFKHLSGLYTFTCMLSGFLEIDLSKYNIDPYKERLKPQLNVQLSQLVLRRR